GSDPFGEVELVLGLGPRRHLAGDLAGQILRVEAANSADAGLAVDEPLPDVLDAYPEWRDHAHPGDNNAPHDRRLPSLAMPQAGSVTIGENRKLYGHWMRHKNIFEHGLTRRVASCRIKG